jgi:ubiquinone/menaquinone biosynthesis C-methylase UbiE
MAERVCPWWLGYLLVSPVRRLFQDPDRILAPYVTAGMYALEPGPGMGFFTIPLARLVGGAGRVFAVDIQPKMLRALERRAAKARLKDRVITRQAQPGSMELSDLAGRIDFVLAFAVVHEMPSVTSFFEETARALKLGGTALFAEPKGHVGDEMFQEQLQAAAQAGLTPSGYPAIWRSHACLLRKQ